MGKTQRKGRLPPRASPLNPGTSTKVAAKCHVDDMPDDAILVGRISDQLQSASPETQECGLHSLVLMLEKSSSTGQANRLVQDLLEHRLVRVVAPFMATEVAKHPDVALAAVGALRNVSIVSGEVCDSMVEQDVMTPLCKLLITFSAADWKATVETGKSSRHEGTANTKSEIFIEAVNLLWNLCEANATALEVLNRESDILATLLRHLAPNAECGQANRSLKYPTRILLPIMQCLYSVTEDNPLCHEIVLSHKACLENIVLAAMDAKDVAASPDLLYLQILGLGVLLNVGEAERNSSLWSVLVAKIAVILNIDQRKMCHEYTSLCPVHEEATEKRGPKKRNLDKNAMDADDGAASLDGCADRVGELSENLLNVVHAQQTALELLTNVACGEDGESEDDDAWRDDSEGSDDNLMERTDSCGDMETEDTFNGYQTLSTVPTFLVELLQSESVVQKVMDKAVFPAENVCQVLREDSFGKSLLGSLATLRSRSFLCLNNLVSALSIDDLGGVERLSVIWRDLANLCCEDVTAEPSTVGSTALDLLESASSAMRAVTQKMVETGHGDQFNTCEHTALKKMLTVGAACQEAKVRVNMIHVAGTIGVGLVNRQGSIESTAVGDEVTRTVLTFLTEAAKRDTELRVVAEALDKIFDVFAEDESDPIFSKLGVMTDLKQILPGMKAKIGLHRKKKRGSDADSTVIAMAKTNLVRFIKYKEKRGLK